MQKQEIEQTIYRKTQQLAVEDLEEVLRFVEFVQFKNKKKPHNQDWQQDFLAISQWDINENDHAVKSWQIEEF
jgi:hypothetical protein